MFQNGMKKSLSKMRNKIIVALIAANAKPMFLTFLKKVGVGEVNLCFIVISF